MTEYIECRVLYNKIAEMEELARKRVVDTPTSGPTYMRYVAQLNERTAFKSMVFDAPAADVAPVVHGKWIMDGKDHCHCSECKEGRNIRTQIGWNFCPNCGAKMDKEADDAQ